MTLIETLDRADRVNQEFFQTIFDQPIDETVVTHKVLLLVAYIDIALEHQSAITLLARNRHPGSAMALARSVVEVLFKGAWLAGRGTEEQAERIRQGRFTWPGMGTIVREADDALQTDNFFQDVKRQSWNELNLFTHSGELQVDRRFTHNDLLSNYTDAELIIAVNATLIASGLVAVPFLRLISREEQASRVEQLLAEIATPSSPTISR